MHRIRKRRFRLNRGLGVVLLSVLGLLPALGLAQAAPSLEERIAALEGREQIRELIYAYGRALDTRDFHAFADLFEPTTGTWVGGFGTATGRDEIFALMDSRIGNAEPPVTPTSHHVLTNMQITVSGDRAQATTKWIFVVPGTDGNPQWRFLGHYEDSFVRASGRWYFARREAFTDIPAQP